MLLSRVLKVRYLAGLLLVLILAASAYAFAAANVVPESGAGDGAEPITGYTVANVTYVLNSTNPANIDSVKFSITATAGAGPPTTVRAKLVTASTTWSTCTLATGTWTCPVSGVTAVQADNLRVVAAQ